MLRNIRFHLKNEYIIKTCPYLGNLHFWPLFKASSYCLSINTNCGYEMSKNGIEKKWHRCRQDKGKRKQLVLHECEIWMFMNKKWGPFPPLPLRITPLKGLPLPIWANARKLSPPDFGFVKQSHRWPQGWLLCINFLSVPVWVWPFLGLALGGGLVIYVFASR